MPGKHIREMHYTREGFNCLRDFLTQRPEHAHTQRQWLWIRLCVCVGDVGRSKSVGVTQTSSDEQKGWLQSAARTAATDTSRNTDTTVQVKMSTWTTLTRNKPGFSRLKFRRFSIILLLEKKRHPLCAYRRWMNWWRVRFLTDCKINAERKGLEKKYSQ